MFAGGAGVEPRPALLAVAEEGRAKVAALQRCGPLIAAVCNPGLRERHWAALAGLVGHEVKRDEVGCCCCCCCIVCLHVLNQHMRALRAFVLRGACACACTHAHMRVFCVRLQATSLKRLLDGGLLEHAEAITELSDAASREAGIEKALDRMADEWAGLSFELATWKETGTHILKGAGGSRMDACMPESMCSLCCVVHCVHVRCIA